VIGENMIKRRLLCLGVIFFVAGCTHKLSLYSSDGETGFGVAEESGKKVTVEISGKRYVGNYVFGAGSVGITSGVGYGIVGSSALTVSSIGTTYVPGSGNGKIFVRSQDNSSMRCEFQYSDGSGLGICQRNDGKIFDLVIGGSAK
jgi:hypothetical protein